MTKKRELKSNESVVSAMRHIKEFNLSTEQIIYRYSVDNLDKICYELGLEAVEGQNEATKAFRIAHALKRCKIMPDPEDRELLLTIDSNTRALEQRRASGCNCG